MNRVVFDVILDCGYGVEWAMTVVGGYLAVALFQPNARQLAPAYRAYRVHRALGEDALAACKAAMSAGDLNHRVTEHTWTLADIQRLRPCRHLTTAQCEATIDRLTAAGALTRVGERDGQDLYRLDLRPPADTASDDEGRPSVRRKPGRGQFVRIFFRVLVAGLVPALTLAACSSTQHTRKPDLSQSPTPAQAPTPPAAALAHTREGAIAFARHWWGKVPAYSYHSLDTSTLRATTLPTCQPCQQMITSVDEIKGYGGRYTGGDVTVIDAQSPPGQAEPLLVSVDYSSQPSRAYDKQGKTTITEQAVTAATLHIYLHWADGRWVVNSLKRAAP
jgi:hypothetical protein